jgi:Na+-transporting NADH:ubiquinone oxidoreductase subunit NqrA
MPTTDQLQFEMQRRVILFNSGTTMPDNTVLGYEGNPNYAATADTPGQTLLYNSPRGTSYIELVNGNLWYKQQIPNTWINLTSGTQSGTAGTSSQNNVVFTTGNQDISGVKNFYSRPTVNGSGVLLIGETGSVALPNTLVYITGNQDISGVKNFNDRPTVNGIGVLLSGEVSTIISGVLYSAQINIKNNNGSTIYKGQPVYVSSAAGTNILVKLASNSGEQTSSKTLGLVYQTSLAQNAQGTIVTEGLLGGFNTNAGEEGDPIWLGPTGSLIFGLANKPYAPNHLVYLGVLTRKHANQGEVFVKIQNGFELEELHNVNINHRNALADKNIIRYDSLSGIWFNDTIDSVLPNSIVYITGNQTISGNKTFDVAPIVSGNKLITGLDLSSYATNADLLTTGFTLDNKINSLSGYVNSQSTSGQVFNTGSILDNKINSLSGYVNSQDIVFSGQIASTGSNLYSSILSLSGLFTGYTGFLDSNFASDTQLFTTGSILDSKINSLSGYVNSQDVVFSGQTFNTGSRLDSKINSLSGYVDSKSITLPTTIVYTTGNQTISGTKTFVENTIFGDPSQGDFLVISGNTFTIYGSGNFTSGLFVNGNPVLTGVDLSSYATNANLFITGFTLDNKINSLSGYVNAQSTSGQVFNTGSVLDNKINSLSGYVNSQDVIFSGQTSLTGSILDNKINSLSGLFTTYTGNLDTTFASDIQLFNTGSNLDNKINSLSGYVNSQDAVFSGQTFNTGSRLDNKINALSGYVNSQTTSGQIFNTGSILDNKINALSGYVNSQDIVFSGQTFNTGSRLDNRINALSGYTNSQNIILSGQIAATGSSLHNSILSLSGLFTGYTGNLDANFATDAQLFATGSTLDNKINSLSGLFTTYTGSLDTTFASDAQLFATGSTLDNKINSLSGYVNSQNIIFSGQTATTGSLLDNKINSLSGVSVLTFGDQNIYGNKNFLNNISVSGTGIFNAIDLNNVDTLNLSGVDISITNANVSLTNRPTVNGTGVALIGELINTGSLLDNKINALSGYVNSQDTLFSGQTSSTGSILDNKINSLSGYVSGISAGGLLPSTIVYTTGDQLISGNKTFLNNISVSGTGNFNNVRVSSIDKLFLSGIDILITGNSSINVYNPIYISGNAVLTGVLPTTQSISNVVYTTGNQLISGNKTFLNNIAVSGTGDFNNVKVSNIDKLFLSGIDMVVTGNSSINVYNAIYISGNPVLTGVIPTNQTITNVVYITGDQTISGTKTFDSPIYFKNGINTAGYGDITNTSGGYIDLRGRGGGRGGNIISIGASQDVDNFSNGGSINLSAGRTDGSPGGSIDMIGGSESISPAGSIDTCGGRGNGAGIFAPGGSIYTRGGGNYSRGGNINISAGYYEYSRGGDILTYGGGGGDDPARGGDILTYAGLYSGGCLNLSNNSGASLLIQTGYLGSQSDGSIYSRINDNLYIKKNGSWEKVITDKQNPVYTTGDQTISGVKTFANTGSFNTLQITNKKLSSYNYISSNFTFGDAHINIVNSSNNVIGILPNPVTSGINYYVQNLNTGVLLITGSDQRTIDGFSNINLYKNESLQLLGVNNIGYTGWISLSVSAGVS